MIILVIIFSFKEADSFLVGPSLFNIDFESNFRQEYGYYITNNGNSVLYLEMNVTGYLAEYITLDTNSAVLEPGETKGFSFLLELPSEVEKPGVHDNHLLVMEGLPEGETGTMIGGRVAIDVPINIRVPYPGKYLEATLSVNDVQVGEVVNFVVKVSNFGKEDLFGLTSIVDIYLKDGKVGSASSESFDILNSEIKELVLDWDSANSKPGIYVAKAIVDYDGKSAKAEASFKIGDTIIEILNISGSEMERGRINKLDIVAQSVWNERIDDVYAQLDVDTGKGVLQSRSESLNFEPWGIRTFEIFLDTKDVEIGDYKAKLTIFYLDKTTEKEFSVKIVKSKLGGIFSIQTILILIIAILVIINLWSYIKRRIKKNVG